MGKNKNYLLAAIIASAFLLPMGTSQAARCNHPGGFNAFMADIRQEAAAKGVTRGTIRSALSGIRYNPKVIAMDRRQSVFAQTFDTFAGRMISGHRMRTGKSLLRKYRNVFGSVERKYGVPGAVITAFWGLETDFGAFLGNESTIRSLSTMAFDCRRTEMFHDQLFAALKLLDRGDLRLSDMKGPWAGELGQTQFLPTHYLDFAVDADGDGRRNLIRSKADVIASTANYLKHMGWKRGQPWLEEVKVPHHMRWDQADLKISHPRSQWARWGVRDGRGGRLKADGLQASLLLPMGKDGPAFLAYDNFKNVYLEWNKSLVYSTTAAHFAKRLQGARKFARNRRVIKPLSLSQTKTLQKALQRKGYDVGKIDGIIGSGTRAAVKSMQKKLGLPADSFPTPELLRRMRLL